MIHLRNDHFPMGTYNKLKMKKFGLCKIVKRHDFGNVYEVEFPSKLNSSLKFNILDLIEFYEGGDGDEVLEAQWSILATILDTNEILGSCIGRISRNITYEEYLVKWKGRPVEDSSWLAREEVDRLGFLLDT